MKIISNLSCYFIREVATVYTAILISSEYACNTMGDGLSLVTALETVSIRFKARLEFLITFLTLIGNKNSF